MAEHLGDVSRPLLSAQGQVGSADRLTSLQALGDGTLQGTEAGDGGEPRVLVRRRDDRRSAVS
jgi:hypothetical protein